MGTDSRPSRLRWALVLFVGFVLVVGSFAVVYRPDRPVDHLVPGSSAGPAFVVQVIRPRLGLPLGGLLPPGMFGLDSRLGFDSASAGATVVAVAADRLELRADDWELRLVLAPDGGVSPDTAVEFVLEFEGKPRRVRGRVGDVPSGSFETTVHSERGEWSGRFELELARCEDAETNEALGWPPEPLVLRGSFDRLAMESGSGAD